MNYNPLQVFTDPALLGQFLTDPSTWEAWLSFICAFFGLKPANRQQKKVFKKCAGGRKWPEKAVSEAWVIVGRRGGKSTIVALIAAFLAAFREYPTLASGEVGHVLIVSVTKAQANIIKRYLSGIFNKNTFLKSLVVRETQTEIELSNGIIITVLTSDFRSIRGYTAIACIVDEIAFFFSEGSKPCYEAIRALRPALATTAGPLITISSPYAKRGALYTTWKNHYGKDSDVLVWQAPSILMNPTLSQETIDRALSEDPEGGQAEWLGRFRSDIESYISRESLEACVVPGRYELPPIPGLRYTAFCDPSGGGRDSMTLAISHVEDEKRVLDCIRERKPPFSPDDVVREFAQTLRHYGISTVTGDRYGGVWPESRFQAHGITYKTSEKVKSDLYKELLPLLNSGQCELLDNEKLIHQLVNLERRTARGGKDSIDHSPNSFDDIANAVAGAFVSGTFRQQARIRVIDPDQPRVRPVKPIPELEGDPEWIPVIDKAGKLQGYEALFKPGEELRANLESVYEGGKLAFYRQLGPRKDTRGRAVPRL